MRLCTSPEPRGRIVRALAVACALTGLAAGPSLAGPHGGGGMSGMNGGFGGRSAGEMSAMGLSHSNGPAAIDRDFGMDRASDRPGARLGGNLAQNSNGFHATDRDHGADRAADRAHRHHHKR